MNYYQIEFKNTEGLIYVRVNGIPIPKARFIVSQLLNRKLEPFEKVFFKKTKNDFTLSNLILVNFKDRTQLNFILDKSLSWEIIKIPHWSRQHPCCIECDTTTIKYSGLGLCNNCYHRKYNKNHRAVIDRTPNPS